MKKLLFRTLLFLVCLMSSVFSLLPLIYAQDYRLGPHDVLKITVYREEEFDREVRVSSDGYISFPLLGNVKAEGLAVSELEESLTEKLKKYLKNPQVTVFISQYSSITVTGQVKKPGSYTLKGDLTVIEAIGLAEGFTDSAGQNEVKVMHMVNGKQKTTVVKVADISKKGDKSEDILLQRGDIIFVPEATISITGQVKNPGTFPLKDELTIIEAIGLAGGFTKFAAQNDVRIMRIKNGEKKIIRVKLADIREKGDKINNVILERSDIIFVPESLF